MSACISSIQQHLRGLLRCLGKSNLRMAMGKSFPNGEHQLFGVYHLYVYTRVQCQCMLLSNLFLKIHSLIVIVKIGNTRLSGLSISVYITIPRWYPFVNWTVKNRYLKYFKYLHANFNWADKQNNWWFGYRVSVVVYFAPGWLWVSQVVHSVDRKGILANTFSLYLLPCLSDSPGPQSPWLSKARHGC